MLNEVVYPKDLAMALASNHIENEVREFESAEERIFVPHGGCFFAESLVIKDQDGKLLRPLLDYKLLYQNECASLDSGRDVVSVIWVLKETVSKVTLDYRVIGGEYSNTVYAILQELKNSGEKDKNVDWNSDVHNKPDTYPPGPHFHRGDDFTDWDKVLAILDGIRKAIIAGDLASWESILNYVNRQIDLKTNAINSDILKDYLTDDKLREKLQEYLKGYITSNQLSNALKNYYTKGEVDKLIADIKTGANKYRIVTIDKSYTIKEEDLTGNTLIRVKGKTIAITFPKFSNLPIGSSVHIKNIDANAVNIRSVSGVRMNTYTGGGQETLERKGLAATVIYTEDNYWDLISEVNPGG